MATFDRLMAERKTAGIELLRRRLACENSCFSVFLDHIRAPDGYEVGDYLVVASKTVAEDLTTGVAVLPCRDEAIGLLRLYRHPVGMEVWEAPRGFVNAVESPADSARRELEEETGLVCPPGCLLDLGAILPEAGIISGRVHLFAALDCGIVREFPGEELGHRAFRWFQKDELVGLLRSSAIEDATTLSALYKLALLTSNETKP